MAEEGPSLAGSLEASRADALLCCTNASWQGRPTLCFSCESSTCGLRLQMLRDKHEDGTCRAQMCYLYNVASASGSLGPSII